MNLARPSVTPSYRLDPVIGWRRSPVSQHIVFDVVSASLRIGKPGDYPVSPRDRFGSFGGQTLPTGVAVAEEGRLWVADEANDRILYYDSLSAQKLLEQSEQPAFEAVAPVPFLPLWRSEPLPETPEHLQHDQFADFNNQHALSPYQLNGPRDIAYSPFSELVIADTGNRRVLIFSWPELRLRHTIYMQGRPAALAYDSQKRLHIADADNGRVLRFDKLWRRDDNYQGGAGQLQTPIALAFDSNDNAMVLDTGPNQIAVLNTAGEVSLFDTLGESVFERRFLVPPMVLEDGELFYPQLNRPNCEKWHLLGITLDTVGKLAGTDIALIARPRSIRLPRMGEYVSEQLDGEITASQWHRLTLDMSVPEGTRVLIQTHTSDRAVDETELADLNWGPAALFSATEQVGFAETLIQNGRGRYLRIRVQLFGDGFTTPTLRHIHVYGPRNSALRYLPAPYRQDPESEVFLDRWLSYFDTLFEEIRFQISDFTRYLDPMGVPAGEYLEWLGSWFDWQFLAQWPEDIRREMIASSVSFFKQRGTLEGLRQMLQWHTGLMGEQPGIVEHYRLRHYQTQQVLPTAADGTAQQQTLFIGGKPFVPPPEQINHWFSVILPASVVPDKAAYDTLDAIIRAQKPAHTEFRLCLFSPGLRVGKQSSIGVDTWLGHYPKAPIGDFTLSQAGQLGSLSSAGMTLGHPVYQLNAAKG